MGANTSQQQQQHLPLNKILVVAKGLYQLNHPLLVSNHPSFQTSLSLRISLKDNTMDTIPQNSAVGIVHPSFDLPIQTTSYAFQNYHLYLPKIENLAGFTISATLNYDAKSASEYAKKSPQQSSSPQPQQQQQEEDNSNNKEEQSEAKSSEAEPKPQKHEGYLSSIFNAVSNTIVGSTTSEYLGAGFVDLRQLAQEDVYHQITIPIVSRNNNLICKIDLSIVRPGLKTEIFDMKHDIVKQQLKPSHVMCKSFERLIRDSNDVNSLRASKTKTELIAQSWINAHIEDRIEIVSIDTTHINSNSGYELITVQVWYKYMKEFVDTAKEEEKERLEKAKEQAEEEEKKKQESSSSPSDASKEESENSEQQDTKDDDN